MSPLKTRLEVGERFAFQSIQEQPSITRIEGGERETHCNFQLVRAPIRALH
jgi:hypothetical protein